MAVDVVTGLRGNAGVVVKDVVTRLRGGIAAGRKDVVTRLRGGTSSGFTVAFAPPFVSVVNPFATIALTAVPSDPTATVTVTQTAGPQVTITGTGLDRAAVAPGTLNGTTLTFQVTAAKTGATTASATYSIAVRAHGGLYRKNGAAVQIQSH